MPDRILLDGASLDFDVVVAVARQGRDVGLSPTTVNAMARSRRWVEDVAGDADARPVYGVNTGYGSLARVAIPPERSAELSMNLIRSHAAGVGPALPAEVVRAAMLLRANALARGASGVEPAVVTTLVEMLNRGVTPVMPERGSCGSSGDLAPLSHLGLVVFDGPDDASGRAELGGQVMSGAEAMRRAGLSRVRIGPKDALAMTNGAQVTAALAALAVVDADRLIRAAEVAAALTFESLQGVTRALSPRVMALRPYRGAIEVAAAIRQLVAGSTSVDGGGRVQDAYALRCAPQVQGSVRDAARYAAAQVRVELNAVTDNPVVLVDADGHGEALSAGLFHGEPLGFAADHLRLALCELAAISERRTYRMTTTLLSSSLPALLVGGGGLGWTMPQVTAASLVNALRQSCWPASADSSPTCEDQEDHVAMSTTAARKTRDAVALAQQVVAIELWGAAAGARFRRGQGARLGVGTAAALEQIDGVAGSTPGEAIAGVVQLVADGSILDAVATAAGPWPGVLGE